MNRLSVTTSITTAYFEALFALIETAFPHVKELPTNNSEKLINKIVGFRLGIFDIDVNGNDWRAFSNKGIVFENGGTRESTKHEDLNTPNILLLGIDYSGSRYSKPYVDVLKHYGIIENTKDIVVAGLSSTPLERTKNHIFPYLNEDTNATSIDSEFILKKFILPRIINGDGSLNENIFNSKKPIVNLICHSHGSTLSYIVENSLRLALSNSHKENNIDRHYSNEIIQKVMDKINILAVGVPINTINKPNTDIPSARRWAILGNGDLVTVKTDKIVSLMIDSLEMNLAGKPNSYIDEQEKRSMTIINSCNVAASVLGIPNIGGHGFAHYMDYIFKSDLKEVLKSFLNGDEYLKILKPNKISSNLEQITPSSIINIVKASFPAVKNEIQEWLGLGKTYPYFR